MKKQLKFVNFAIMIIAVLSMSSCLGYERIDAGYDGIRVNKYGDEKGVDKVSEVTGVVWYNKIRYAIYEVPTYVQDYNYPEMELKTQDMLSVSIGAGVQVQLPSGETPALFIKYRRYFSNGGVDLDELIYKHTRQAFSDAAGQYKAEELITKKTEFRNVAEQAVKDALSELDFLVEDVFLIGDPGLPETIMKQVNQKIEADQIAQKKESELRQAEADAKKVVATAQGDSDAMIITARAEAKAYELQNRALSNLILQKMFIERWDGNYGTGNVFGAGVLPYKQIK